MAQASGFVWIVPPAGMARALDQYGDKVLAAVQAVADFIAGKMQADARRNAKWQDRTGNARSGLFAVARREAAKDIVAIYLSHGHTIYYGIFLELARGGRYAIIVPTIEKHLPELKRMLDDLFK
ncbi:MAG: hypothetical protein FOGNACKC_02241 [Anaerolineae bacterium]|nr:hypothetical protein [Anaerolineae bacterium]